MPYAITARPQTYSPSTHPQLGVDSKHKELHRFAFTRIFTAELLRDAYFDKVEALKEKTLLTVIREHNEERKMMVGKTVAPATYWAFEHTERLLKKFINGKCHHVDYLLVNRLHVIILLFVVFLIFLSKFSIS